MKRFTVGTALACLVALLSLVGCATPGGVQATSETSAAEPEPVVASGTEPTPGVESRAGTIDLDGDGRPERLRGTLDTWTTAEIDVLDAEGKVIAKLTTSEPWEHKVTPIKLVNPNLTVLLRWRRYPQGRTDVGVQTLTFRDGAWGWQSLGGWGLKHADSTVATRAHLTPEGLLNVEWDLGDPARHTRVRQYQLDLPKGLVQLITETLRPQDGQLIYPTAAEGVLQAAYVSAVHALNEELPLYFASDAAMTTFRETVGRAPMEVSGIRLARAEVLDEYCSTKQEPAQPGPDGSAPFVMRIGGNIYLDVTMGTVSFVTDQTGRITIQDFSVTDRCPNG